MDDTRKALLSQAARAANAYLDGVAERPVRPEAGGEALRQALTRPWADTGAPASAVIERLAEAGRIGTVATQGPRYFGFVVGGSLPVATAADWLVSAWDQNAGLYLLSPVVSVVESVAAGWLREIAGLGAHWSVGYVTGCQMANFAALASARHHVLAASGWDVESQGLIGAPPVDVIVSDESHYTVFMALRLLGFGADRVRRVPTDGQGRMRADRLAATLAQTSSPGAPCIVCAQAGNVNTGAFDPLDAIAEAAGSRGAWLHVDGAFGFWAAASPALAPLLAGLSRADSIATDAHKWLNVPYDSGLVLTAHAESHRRALTRSAAYILEERAERDPREFVPEESRRARAVPVYAALATLGPEGLRALVERSVAHARRMAARLEGHPDVRILNEIVLNQVLVRIERPGADADALTRDVIARVQADGTCWLGSTEWHGIAAMRISFANWSTTEADVDRSAEAILRAVSAPAPRGATSDPRARR